MSFKKIPLTEAQADTLLRAIFEPDSLSEKEIEAAFEEVVAALDKAIDEKRLEQLHTLRFKLRAALRVLAPDTTLIHNYGTASASPEWKSYENIVLKAGRNEATRIVNSIVTDVDGGLFDDDPVVKAAVQQTMFSVGNALNTEKADYYTGNARRIAAAALRTAIVLVENEIEELLPVETVVNVEPKLTGEFEAKPEPKRDGRNDPPGYVGKVPSQPEIDEVLARLAASRRGAPRFRFA